MARIQKNDTVMVLAGRDKGKTGRVLSVFPDRMCALVEGVNFVKKHMRKTREDRPGGIVQRESPIHLSNLSIYCTKCSRATRIGITVLKDGTKTRYCKNCKELI